ncbi:MAG: 3-oxoacyl-[acyl-carrier-protein] synthase III C-terminal domain-containing protein [Planctomycetota bacterium]|nr:3-oxoacyl-[acyl-carrier-protein] synthase III C-terminal domain-containing protein [Planctomycetota bacterium]
MRCYITQTGSFLPNNPVPNGAIQTYLGTLDGESSVQDQVLAMNGIVQRHYAQDEQQHATHDVYELAELAVRNCLANSTASTLGYLAAGSTYAPLSGPGFTSILHHRLQRSGVVLHPLEISSHSGICTSGAAALVAAIRAVDRGDHSCAVSVGAEHASEILKSTIIRPIDDRDQHADIRQSQWFSTVFLRFMLSDGAGAVLLQDQPSNDGLSLSVDWTYSRSYAHEAPLCMKLENPHARLSQDVTILSRHLVPLASQFLASAMLAHGESLESYRVVLPHMSSYFFRRKLERVIRQQAGDSTREVSYWTNLATAGNTGAASIYIMLDEFVRQQTLSDGDRVLLFVPESGQFNFVMISLTVVGPK